jgi:hypothetical protein
VIHEYRHRLFPASVEADFARVRALVDTIDERAG